MTSPLRIHDGQAARPPPQVIRVPPPEGRVATPGLLLAAAALLALIGIPCMLSGLMGMGVQGFLVGLMFLAVAAVCAWAPGWGNRRYARQRAEYLAQRGAAPDDPLVTQITTHWQRADRPPKPDGIRAVLQAAPAAQPPRARIVCLGMLDVPEVGEFFFEPEIITPTQYVGRVLTSLLVALAISGVWLFEHSGFIRRGFLVGPYIWYVLATGLAAAVVWIWRGAIRPTYVRMAPGVIQVLEYRYRRARPIVRSYPVDPETAAVVYGATTDRKDQRFKVVLLRGESRDTIDLSRVRRPAELIEKVWQALLSTAPTPPLSEEALVG